MGTSGADSTGGRSSNTIKAKVVPHEITVNELPSHSHDMTGYWYGDVGSAYTFLVSNSNGEFILEIFLFFTL